MVGYSPQPRGSRGGEGPRTLQAGTPALIVAPARRFAAPFIGDSSPIVIVVEKEQETAGKQEAEANGVRHLSQDRRDQGREQRRPTPRGDRGCFVLVGSES